MKDKIKKIFVSVQLFLASMISKVSAINPLYGVEIEPEAVHPYQYVLTIGKFVLPIIIGLLVIISKKITKKVKVIIISILIVLVLIKILVMNYINNLYI